MSKDEAAVEEEAARGDNGRFGVGLPRRSDGQMLFLQHFIARMNDPAEAQSYIGIILNGSPLFTGDAGSGESEIRRWILENDWLEAIVALPQQIFYNTGIATYIWLLSNRKPASHRGKVMLVDASGDEFWSPMTKSLGSKRREITDEHRRKIIEIVKHRQPGDHVKLFETIDFGYRQIRVERPLRLRFEISEESLARLEEQTAFKNLAISKKKDRKEREKEEGDGQKAQSNIRKALQTLTGEVYKNRDKFRAAVEAASNKGGVKLKAPVFKAITTAFGERDETADICLGSDGQPEPDKSLSDTENVPLREDIHDYFKREVLPHIPDAWIDLDYVDERDSKVGRVGYEIPFNHHFYVYKPPRALENIDAELKIVTGKILEMIGGLTR